MSNKKPPLTDYQKTVYTSEEQELLRLGAHIVSYEYSDDEIEMAKSLIQSIRQLMGEPLLTKEELTLIVNQAKNKAQF